MTYLNTYIDKNMRRPAGAALLLVLAALIFLGIIATMWTVSVYYAAQSAVLQHDTAARDAAMHSGLAHARALIHSISTHDATTVADTALATPWHTLVSSQTHQVSYRVRISDTALIDTITPSYFDPFIVRYAARVTETPRGMRSVLDPRVAPLDLMCDVMRDITAPHGFSSASADAMALAIADAYDHNHALCVHPAADVWGDEGVQLLAVHAGAERSIPVDALLAQSRFYDCETHKNSYNIYHAFSLSRVTVDVPQAGVTNMKVRLSDAPSQPFSIIKPGWRKAWQTFDALWQQSYETRFIPGQFDGVRADMHYSCGGRAGTVTITHNDGNYLYIEGYHPTLCAEGNLISLHLRTDDTDDGEYRFSGRTDVVFITGVYAHVAYQMRGVAADAHTFPGWRVPPLYGDVSVAPGALATNGMPAWATVRSYASDLTDVGGIIGVEISAPRAATLAGFLCRKPSRFLFHYSGARPVTLTDYALVQMIPENDAPPQRLQSFSADTHPRNSERNPATLFPGDVLELRDDDDAVWSAAFADIHSVSVPRETAGAPFRVVRTTREDSPHGGVALRIFCAVHHDYPWKDGRWHGSHVTLKMPGRTLYHTFPIMSHDHHSLTIHVGPTVIADTYTPRAGDVIYIGTLADAARRAPLHLISPFGEKTAAMTLPDRTLPPAQWVVPDVHAWRTTSRAHLRTHIDANLTSATHADVAQRITALPVWQRHMADSTRMAETTILTEIHARFITDSVYEELTPIATHAWAPTAVNLAPQQRNGWRITDAQTPLPSGIFDNYIVQFSSNAFARVIASDGAHLTTDWSPMPTRENTVVLSPHGTDAGFIATTAHATGMWQITVSPTHMLPVHLTLSGMHTPLNNDTLPATMDVAIYNPYRTQWENVLTNATFDQRGLCSVGDITRMMCDTQGRVRLRVVATRPGTWLRGVYSTPTAHIGARTPYGTRRSDAFIAQIDTRVSSRRSEEDSVTWHALFHRVWNEREGALYPEVIPVQMRRITP